MFQGLKRDNPQQRFAVHMYPLPTKSRKRTNFTTLSLMKSALDVLLKIDRVVENFTVVKSRMTAKSLARDLVLGVHPPPSPARFEIMGLRGVPALTEDSGSFAEMNEDDPRLDIPTRKPPEATRFQFRPDPRWCSALTPTQSLGALGPASRIDKEKGR